MMLECPEDYNEMADQLDAAEEEEAEEAMSQTGVSGVGQHNGEDSGSGKSGNSSGNMSKKVNSDLTCFTVLQISNKKQIFFFAKVNFQFLLLILRFVYLTMTCGWFDDGDTKEGCGDFDLD